MTSCEKFKLFVGEVQEVPQNVKYYFYNASANYILIYTNAEDLDGFSVVDEGSVKLTYDEKIWLFSCKQQENSAAVKNDPAFLDFLEAFMDDIEKLKGGLQDG